MFLSLVIAKKIKRYIEEDKKIYLTVCAQSLTSMVEAGDVFGPRLSSWILGSKSSSTGSERPSISEPLVPFITAYRTYRKSLINEHILSLRFFYMSKPQI